LATETKLLNEARQKGITLTAAERAELIAVADQLAENAVATKRAKEALDFAKDATKGFLDDLRQGLENGEGFWKSFGNAALNVLNKIIDKIENDLINALFDVKSGGGGGLGSLILSGVNALFGVGGGGSYGTYGPGVTGDPWAGLRLAKGGVFDHGISAYSNSIVSRPTLFKFARGTGLMGEAGPEGILPLRRNSQGQLGVIASGTANNNQPAAYNDNRTFNIDARGAQEGVEKKIVAAIAEYDRQTLPRRVKAINADPRAIG
jgi:lambda family phage tail tape measure protein